MVATLAQLGARALQRVGLAPVSVSGRPAAGPTVPASVIAARVLRLLGANPVAEAAATITAGTTTFELIANKVLQRFGVDPVNVGGRPPEGSTVTVAVIADRVLKTLGINLVSAATDTPPGGVVALDHIATQALRRLAIVAAEETPSSADQLWAEQAVGQVLQTLYQVNLFQAVSPNIPVWAEAMLVIMSADRLAPSYGLPSDEKAFAAAVEDIKAATLSKDTAQLLAEIEVNAAYQAVNALGFVNYTVTAIPSAVADELVVMAVSRLAPTYGKPRDDAGYEASLQRVRAFLLASSVGHGLAVEKVAATHELLAGLNLITWTALAIPDYAEEFYVSLAADMLGPTFDRPRDPAAFTSALEGVRALAISGAAGQGLAEAEVNAAHGVLVSLGYVTWTSAAIPEAVSSHYAQMAAVRIAPVYGRPVDEKEYAMAVDMVRLFCMNGPTGQALAEAKIMEAHISLDGRGITRWDFASMPDYAEGPLVMMAAEVLAPEVGQPLGPVQGGWLEGEKQIRRLTMLPTSGDIVQATYY